MSQGRYSQRGWAFQSWAFRPWGLAGAGQAPDVPTDGWRSGQFNRVSVATETNRTAVAGELSRVVWASPQGK